MLKHIFSLLFQVNKLIPATASFLLPEVKCIVFMFYFWSLYGVQTVSQ